MTLSRRRFLGAGAGLALLTACGQAGGAEQGAAAGTRTVTTALGTYDVPADPQRVIAIDSRIDLEPAVALGLPLIGHAYDQPAPWVPVPPPGVPFLSEIPNVEQILGLDPDLIVCFAPANASEYWPVDGLQKIAPVLPTSATVDWRVNLRNLGEWTGRSTAAERAVGEYEAKVAAVKERHATAIATRKVIAVSYLESNDQLYSTSILDGDKSLHPAGMVLADLGGHSPEAALFADDESLAMENVDRIADCDAILISVSDGPGSELAALQAHPLWQQLPAVAAGRTAVVTGPTYYGAGYTVGYLADAWDRLYTTL